MTEYLVRNIVGAEHFKGTGFGLDEEFPVLLEVTHMDHDGPVVGWREETWRVTKKGGWREAKAVRIAEKHTRPAKERPPTEKADSEEVSGSCEG